MARMKCRLLAAATFCLIPGAGQTQQPSIQQQFEAASDALGSRKWEDALSIFESLEKRLATNPRSIGLVSVRKAEALTALGRDEEAEKALLSGLAALPENDPSLAEDRLLGRLALALINERALDYGEALRLYRHAHDEAHEPSTRLRSMLGLIRTEMFYDGTAALANADRALALIASQPEGSKSLTGAVRILKGRTLLNLGRIKEGRAELETAVRELGGLTLKVDAADISARSDLALAALLDKDRQAAQRYLAYTGAGRLPDGFRMGEAMTPPACGGDGDLRPDDVAVVEFSIRPDGSVGTALPIYASREGDSALAFARAVAQWSWTPEAMASVPTLFRLLTRVELRCTMADERPSPVDMLIPDAERWLAARDVAPAPTLPDSDARQVKILVDELARRETQFGENAIQLLPILSGLASNRVISLEAANAHGRRAFAIARAHEAPPAVLGFFGMKAASAGFGRRIRAGKTTPPDLSALLADSTIASDPRAEAAIRLTSAEMQYRWNKDVRAAIAHLIAIRDLPGLSPLDPFRTAALARLSSLQFVSGQAEQAQESFRLSGLTANQCALLDTPPRKKSGSASSNDYPEEALNWGFSGWTAQEYDIRPDGKTTNVRTIVSYPPFVFGAAGNTIAKRLTFEKSFRPEGDLGCSGAIQRMVFNRGY